MQVTTKLTVQAWAMGLMHKRIFHRLSLIVTCLLVLVQGALSVYLTKTSYDTLQNAQNNDIVALNNAFTVQWQNDILASSVARFLQTSGDKSWAQYWIQRYIKTELQLKATIKEAYDYSIPEMQVVQESLTLLDSTNDDIFASDNFTNSLLILYGSAYTSLQNNITTNAGYYTSLMQEKNFNIIQNQKNTALNTGISAVVVLALRFALTGIVILTQKKIGLEKQFSFILSTIMLAMEGIMTTAIAFYIYSSLSHLADVEVTLMISGWKIMELDEVLTTSAARYIQTNGDVFWKNKYISGNNTLNNAFDTAIYLAQTPVDLAVYDSIGDANNILVFLENEILNSNSSYGYDILYSQEYETNKYIFNLGVSRFLDTQQQRIDSQISVQAVMVYFLLWFCVAFTAVSLVITWFTHLWLSKAMFQSISRIASLTAVSSVVVVEESITPS